MAESAPPPDREAERMTREDEIRQRYVREFVGSDMQWADTVARDVAWLLGELARVRRDRQQMEDAQQRLEWIATAFHGDPVYGKAWDDPLFRQAVQLRNALERIASEDWRGNKPAAITIAENALERAGAVGPAEARPNEEG